MTSLFWKCLPKKDTGLLDDFAPMESGGEWFDNDGGSRAGSASHRATPNNLFSFDDVGYDDGGGTYDDDLSIGDF